MEAPNNQWLLRSPDDLVCVALVFDSPLEAALGMDGWPEISDKSQNSILKTFSRGAVLLKGHVLGPRSQLRMRVISSAQALSLCHLQC